MESTHGAANWLLPVRVVATQPSPADPGAWFHLIECSAGGPSADASSLATELSDARKFQTDLPMVRAGGSGQALATVGELRAGTSAFGACDVDGD